MTTSTESEEARSRTAVEVIAHRGYSARAPENTVAALRAAMECGAPAVEWDIHVSASGTPHLFHDDTLERTAGQDGHFADLTDVQVEHLDAGSWFDPSYAGEPVPTLRRALSALGPPLQRIYPEIKAYRELADVDRMADEVAEAGWLDRAVFISMEWDALARVRRRHPKAWVGYIAETAERYPAAVTRAREDPRAIVDPGVRIALAHADITARAIEAGTDVAVWTVNDLDTAARALALGITRLTTNEVGMLLEWTGLGAEPGGAS